MTTPKKSKKVASSAPAENLEIELQKEWKHFLRFKDENKLLFTAFVMLIAALVIINAVYVIKATRNDQDDAAAQSGNSQILGTQFNAVTPALRAKVTGVASSDREDKAFPLAANEQLIIFTLEVTNTSDETQDLYPARHMYVRDEEGRIFIPHASSYVTKPFPAGSLAPGQTVAGELSFAIDKTTVTPKFYLDTGWKGLAPVVYDLSR